MAVKSKPNEIYISRIYDAPVNLVWQAWVDPVQVAKWWGPRGFTLTTVHKDVRPGGTWKYTMHGPDGVDYPNLATYHEVEKHSRLVYDHGATETTPPLFKVTVNFSEKSGKTKMEMTMALATEEAATQTKKFIKSAGGNATWDRLAEFLSSKDVFVINRSFEAPVDRVFDVWTKPEHLAKWLAPTGASMNFIEANFKVGGTNFYNMTTAEGHKMFGKIKYLEINKPHHLVYTQIFCQEDGSISRHPMAPTWPETMLTTVTFAEEDHGTTRVTVTWQVYGEATDVERQTFHGAKGGMTQGWTGSFDKLDAYLEESR